MSLSSCSFFFTRNVSSVSSGSFNGSVKVLLSWINPLSMFPNPRKDLTSFLVVDIGQSMPSSFIGFSCCRFPESSNSLCSVFVTQEVHSSGSGKRSLSPDRRNTLCIFGVLFFHLEITIPVDDVL